MRTINPAQRDKLKQPFGKVMTLEETIEYLKGKKNVVVVGDKTLINFINNNVPYWIGIFDFKTKRVEISQEDQQLILTQVKDLIKVNNPPRVITLQLENVIREALSNKKNKHIWVEGEEDLAVTPLIEQAKEGTIIVYGMPDKGIVVCQVDTQLKEKVEELYA